MTREELRKKRKEIAESNGYKGYVPKTRAEGTRETVRNPEPMQEKKSTWSNVMQRIGNTMDYISGGQVQRQFNRNNTVNNNFARDYYNYNGASARPDRLQNIFTRSMANYGKGNIDLNNRPIVKNEDGSISTVRSMSFYDDNEKKEILIPTVVGNRVVSDQEAIDHYYETGEHLGKFDTPEEADKYAEELHLQQEQRYGQKQKKNTSLRQDANRILTAPNSTVRRFLGKELEIGRNLGKRITNPTQYAIEDLNKTARKGIRTIKEGKTDLVKGWVDKGAFSNGYQFGDVTRSAVGTTADITKQAFKGAIAQPGEALGDLMSIAQAGYNEYIKGDKKRAEAILRKASEDHGDDIASGALGVLGTAYKYLGKGQKAQLLLELGQAVAKGGNVGQNLKDSVMNTFRQKYGYYKNVGEDSLLGEAGEDTVSSMAKNARQRYIQEQLGIPWQSQMFLETVPETYLQKRIKEGMSTGQSVASSLADFGIEWFTEEMFDGIKLKGTGNTTINKFLDANINKLQDNFERTTLKYLKGVYGEATEEVVGAYMSALSDYLIKHFENKDWTMEDIAQAIKDVTMDPNTWKGAISAGLSVGGQTVYTLGGDVRGIYRNEQRNQAIIDSSLSQEDKQTLIDSMEYEAPEKPSKKEIQKQEEMKGEVDEILNKLDGEEKKRVQSALEQGDISSTIQESELDENQKNALSNIAQKYQLTLDEIQTAIEKTKNGEYALDELTRTQNEETSEQEQQITQAEGKTSQNETSQENGENNIPNSFNGYTQKELDNFKNSNTIKIANNKDDIVTLAKSILNLPNKVKIFAQKVTSETAKKIKESLGIDIDGYNISLNSDGIRHSINKHGNEIAENLRGQEPITLQDLKNIPDIVNNYDNAYLGNKTKAGNETLIFEKNINGTNMVVTYVSDRHHNLELKTMYKFKDNKKIDSAKLSNEINSLDLTSKTDNGTNLFDNSITQNKRKIKLSQMSVKDAVKDYLEKTGRKVTDKNVQAFIERASNFKLEEGDNSNPELRRLIERIQKQNIEENRIGFANSTEIPTKDEIIRGIYENVTERTSKDNQKNNKRIQEYLEKTYPNLKIDFTNFKNTGNVKINDIKTNEQIKENIELYNKQEQALKEQKEKEAYKTSPLNKEDEFSVNYGELPSTQKQLDDYRDIRDRINNLSKEMSNNDFNVVYDESKASADATYLTIQDSNGNELGTIRIANHYKLGSSGNADINIDLSEYTSKSAVVKDVEKAINNLTSSFDDIFNMSTEELKNGIQENEGKVQGLENYTKNEIKEITNDYIKQKLEENGYYSDDIEIIDSEIHGSRNRGTAREDSDLDVVVEYEGYMREDDLFNMLNDENPLYIDGIKVDINPITANRTGTLQEYMEESNKYDKKILTKMEKEKQAVAGNNYVTEGKSARFTEDRLNYIIRGSVNDFSDNYARSYVAKISPEQFLQLTSSPDYRKAIENESTELDPEQLKREKQNIFLYVNMKTGQVTGHEGRHRMVALQKAGIENVDIEIIPDSGTYNRSNAQDYDNLYISGQRDEYNTGTTLHNVLAVTKNNVDKIKQEYLGNENKDDIRYSLTDKEIEAQGDNSEENRIDREINQAMTPKEVERMLDEAFSIGKIKDWFDGKYQNGKEWLEGEGPDEVALVIENDWRLQRYLNAIEGIVNDDFTISEVLDAYTNGTLANEKQNTTQRLDTSINTGYETNKFYSPRKAQAGIELYNKAIQRVTKENSQEVYQARADFIFNSHKEGYVEGLGLDVKEINKKIQQWANYTQRARNISNQVNEGSSEQNRWVGIENCSIVNKIAVTDEEMKSMVKEVKGESLEYERKYITTAMLAYDGYTDFSGLTFNFSPDRNALGERALANFDPSNDTINVGRSGLNTIAHEIGHFIDHLFGRQFFGNNLGITDKMTMEKINSSNLTDNQKQWVLNFYNFFDSISSVSDLRNSYTLTPTEIFARFGARFVEWTNNVANNNRYGYESKYYDDGFTESQFKEFAKLLQEKNLIDSTEKYANYNKENYGSGKIAEDRLDDFFDDTFEDEVKLPKANKVLNPTQISNLTLEDASTTPKLPSKNYKKGTKISNFVSNIENDVGFLNEEEKQELLKDDNVKYYAGITNADTLAKAYDNLKENGKDATLKWYAKPTANATAEDVATGWILLKQYSDEGDTEGMVNVAKKLRDMGSKAGQTVQAFNILSRLTPEGMVAYAQGELQDAYNEMIKGKSKKWIDQHKSDFDLSQDEVAFIMDTMQNLPAENPMNNNYDRKVALGQIQKLFTDKIPSENNRIKAWMRISMLFNPKTQVRNVSGNAGVIPVNMTSDFLGSKVDKILSKYTGVRTLGNPNAKAYLKGMKEGFYQSYNDFRLGINTRDIEQNKFEFGQGKAFKDKGIGKALNRVDNMLNFIMDFGDRGFSQASFVNSLNNQMLLNGVTTPTQDMIDIATQEALSRTWNDNNEYTKFVLGVRRALNKVGTKNYGLGDVLIPFAKTPANLTKAIVEYSPVGLTKQILNIKDIKNAIETDQFTAQQQHEFADKMGKGLAGTLLYIAGYALAQAGIATGEPDEDKDVKNFMKNSLGIAPYSIKIGDKSFTYDWSQPVATPLAIMTNLYQTNKNNPDATMLDKIMSATNIGTNQLMEQSFMESLNEVLNGNGEITDRIQKAILDLPARAIPTFSKQIADMVDGTQRTSFEYGQPVKSAINSAKAKLPFVSKELTPVVDTLGNEVEKYGGENNWFNVFFNPANMNKGKKTKAGEEIYNVYQETGDTTIFPVTAPYYVNQDGAKITMDSKQRAEYQKTAGDYTEETVNKLINDSDYQKLDDPEKAEILSQVVKDSNEKAKRDVLNINNKSSDLELIDKVGADYYTYKIATKGMKTDAEQCEALERKNYSNQNKQLIYESEINKDDKTFEGLKKINKNFNMDEYLKYKTQKFSGDTKKEDTINYVNGLNLNGIERLYIIGRTYKLKEDRELFESLLKNKMPLQDVDSILQTLK